LKYGISHSMVYMKLKRSSVAAALRVQLLKSPGQMESAYFLENRRHPDSGFSAVPQAVKGHL
jgi:hypothetical protein